MISFTDFEDEFGVVNWKALRVAEIAGGHNCKQCGSICRGKATGSPRLCYQCTEAMGREELNHDSRIRCPKCGAVEVVDCDRHWLWDDGSHDVTCWSCDHDYEVQTTVSFNFCSPARLDT